MTLPTKLADYFKGGRCAMSFELFPPKTDEGMALLEKNVERLQAFHPNFFTCTYGAGGSTQSRTLDVVEKVKAITGLPVASHLTCVGSTVDQLRDYLKEAKRRGADHIVALRGDPPKGSETFQAVEGGLRYANELVELIRADFGQHFGIAVAGYPEVHQEAPDPQTDLDNLKRKVDAGADVVVTQLFYENSDFYRFRDDCVKAGINVPIVPGILPVTNYKQACRIAAMCKARIPDEMAAAMNESDDADFQFNVGVDHARRQTIDLIENDVPGIHYYVLNKSSAAAQMLDGLSLGADA
ncbi:methylenetetrahydrofolate reductase [NAD(P)H] [Roseiconus nitratireducens]|uniref:Methylenetetrahydrofolate reductase n=1 Tax=Roseiconus nitratireducens TaxID=2605748 RepID=A0A5M6CXD7_9BACT|nr:methylenetetrahydrofolate reductase [NAD(P)H] [Roseiconus nitratireducens]KAA5539596.1 methylenetetrahydrofolate reductase [NAD(P)H] [Roseiconus nitratireducens]